MKKKAIVLVPHQDDEINIAGSLFHLLLLHGIETTVVFSTNGDYHASLAEIRYQEALRVKEILKYKTLIYLGYGDEYKGEHIYHAVNKQPAISTRGRNKTYFPGSENEYCYSRYSTHHTYTRENYKSDIKNIIMDLLPDIIICVDYDSHPDHRCLSLLFDEAMGEILKESKDYMPLVLKKFAYLGVWLGPNDYFCKEAIETQSIIRDEYVLSYPYVWDDRIRVPTPLLHYDLLFWKSPVFKAICGYQSQSQSFNPNNSGLTNYPKIVNTDTVYWQRRTDNIALNSHVRTSSGNPTYLTDFKLYDTKDIRSKNILQNGLFWTPDKDDNEKSIVFKFNDSVDVSLIVVYQHPDFAVKQVRISADIGFSTLLNCDKSQVVKLKVPILHGLRQLTIDILDGYSDEIKVGEIEMFSTECENADLKLLLNEMKPQPLCARNSAICKIMNILYALYCQIRIRINNRKWRGYLNNS